MTSKKRKKYWQIIFFGMLLFLTNSMCEAKQKIVLSGPIIIDKPSSYKNVNIDLRDGYFLIINNARLEIENCKINGSVSIENPALIRVARGTLSLKNNTFHVASLNLPADPTRPSLYALIKVNEGKLNITGNHFMVDKVYTVGLLVTSTANTSDFNIMDNTIHYFHGGILLRNSNKTKIINNTFKNVSSGNIYIINGSNSLIKGNILLFSGNNNVGDGIDVIASNQIELSYNLIFSGSCYSIIILKSKNITLAYNRIMGGITYAISIMSSLGLTNPYEIHLKEFLIKNNINIDLDSDNQNIIIMNNYLSQNRYGLSASNVNGLIVKDNIFVQRFVNKESRKFWTNNDVLFHNVTDIQWNDNIYKEAYSQNDNEGNDNSQQFVEFPLFGGVVF